jgi:hypothetical protein
MPSLGNEHVTEAPEAARPEGKVESAPGESRRPKRAYVKPVLKCYGVLKSVVGSDINFRPSE